MIPIEFLYVLTALGVGGGLSAAVGSHLYMDRKEALKLRKQMVGMDTSRKIEHLMKYASQNPLNPPIARRAARKELNDQDFETFLKTMYLDAASLEEWRKFCKSHWYYKLLLRGQY